MHKCDKYINRIAGAGSGKEQSVILSGEIQRSGIQRREMGTQGLYPMYVSESGFEQETNE